MYIRKLAAAAGLATGAALTLAPLAAADPSSYAFDTLNAEINSQNDLFSVYALLTGDSKDIVAGTAGTSTTLSTYDQISPGSLETVAPHLTPGVGSLAGPEVGTQATTVGTFGQVTPLETDIYGANPILAGISGNTGPYNEFNGALTEFNNAYNVLAFSAANGGALDTNTADYLGSATTIGNAVSGPDATVQSAYTYFLDYGLGDLKGYDAIFSPNATGAGDIQPVVANEIVNLNNLYELDGKLSTPAEGASTGTVFQDITPNTNADFGSATATDSHIYVAPDTISADDVTKGFQSLITGADTAGAATNSTDLYNGGLAQLLDAVNVADYASTNSGALLPTDLVLGTAISTTDATTPLTLATEYLTAGITDFASYFGLSAEFSASVTANLAGELATGLVTDGLGVDIASLLGGSL